MSALNTNVVALPGKPQIAIAAVPRMRSRNDPLKPWSLPANQGIGKKRFVPEGAVVLEADVDCQTLGEQHLSRNAMHIPGIPTFCETRLGALIFRRLCRSRTWLSKQCSIARLWLVQHLSSDPGLPARPTGRNPLLA